MAGLLYGLKISSFHVILEQMFYSLAVDPPSAALEPPTTGRFVASESEKPASATRTRKERLLANRAPLHKLRRMAGAIQSQPGLTKSQLRRATGLSWDDIKWGLAALEARGILLSEDQEGRLYPFRPIDLERITLDRGGDPRT
jgi:hypothetical protein